MSRITGWTAHIMEQYNDNRLIRPRADYVGKTNQKYIPIEQRLITRGFSIPFFFLFL